MPGIRLWQLFEFESEMLRSIQLYNALSVRADEHAAYDLIEAAGPHGSGAAPLLR
jgi:hypothetical protein